jgi:colanic acid/amylovoran biosynthesis glycosyltransferase
MIAITHYSLPRDISGVTNWLLPLMSFLRSRGEEVCLNLHHFGSDPAASSLAPSARALGVHVEVKSHPEWTEDAVRDDIRFLNRFRPSVYLPQCLPAHFYSARVAASAGVPCAVALHSDDPHYWALADTFADTTGPVSFVAVSAAILEKLPFPADRFGRVLIPYGVPIPAESAKWSDERFRVVYSGRFVERQKNVTTVLESLLRFCAEYPAGEAVLIGGGPRLDPLQRRVAEAGMETRVRFTGRLAPEEVGDELLRAHAILLMSDFEGLPVAFLEGMARGLVPVSRRTESGIPELVRDGETGLLVADDPNAVAAALGSLAQDRHRWCRLSQNARSLVANHYEEKVCFEKWWQLIEELREHSSGRYPITAASARSLPPPDPRLEGIDLRTPAWPRRVLPFLGWLSFLPVRILRRLFREFRARIMNSAPGRRDA